MPFSRAIFAVIILPSMPLLPNPPGIRMALQHASSCEIPSFSTFSESKNRHSILVPSSAPAWWNASRCDR
jgi:hypothetical protein